MLVGAQIVDPEFVCPGFLRCWFAVEEEEVGLNALGVDLNLLGAKNETGRPKAERAGANESSPKGERLHQIAK